MKKKWIIGVVLAVLAVIMVAVLIVCLTKNKDVSRDLQNIVNKEVSLTEGIVYCNGVSEDTLKDDFSKVYSQTVKMKVESIDETTMVATVTVIAPPLRDIMEDCLPESDEGNYEAAFASYMSDVYAAIGACPAEKMVTTMVDCSVVDNEGLKLIPNNDFTEAMFPDIQQLLSELLLEVFAAEED